MIGRSATPLTSIISGSLSAYKLLMFADKILVKSYSTSTGANLTMKFSSQLGAIDPFFGMIENAPASSTPL